ncbi:MAG TPA: hypothetical protein VLU46_01955 [Thermoanaerobaculia bacterium]|nr:hypothetical protein [Thermoanaerobaculia bacterium]
MLRRVVGVAFLLVACHRESPTDPGAAMQKATLAGRVYYIETNSGVGHTRVVARTSGERDRETLTDDAGRYGFADLTPGAFEIDAGGPNPSDIGVAYQLTIHPGLNTLDLPVSNANCTYVYGIVRDAITYRGIGGATLDIGPGQGTSNASGSFAVLMGCPPHYIGSSISISVQHTGYMPYTSMMIGPRSGSQTIGDILLQRQ